MARFLAQVVELDQDDPSVLWQVLGDVTKKLGLSKGKRRKCRQPNRLHVALRTLEFRGKRTTRLELVAKELEPNWTRCVGRKHVQNAATHTEFARDFHHFGMCQSAIHKPAYKFVHLNAVGAFQSARRRHESLRPRDG